MPSMRSFSITGNMRDPFKKLACHVSLQHVTCYKRGRTILIWFYENWTIKKAKIHHTCRLYSNDGRGIHLDAIDHNKKGMACSLT